ncbi:MAG: hypothetical protein ACJAW7_002591 [Candidatus Azotimanducaceae bacterium]|jgi:hypothetical protein
MPEVILDNKIGHPHFILQSQAELKLGRQGLAVPFVSAGAQYSIG